MAGWSEREVGTAREVNLRFTASNSFSLAQMRMLARLLIYSLSTRTRAYNYSENGSKTNVRWRGTHFYMAHAHVEIFLNITKGRRARCFSFSCDADDKFGGEIGTKATEVLVYTVFRWNKTQPWQLGTVDGKQ